MWPTKAQTNVSLAIYLIFSLAVLAYFYGEAYGQAWDQGDPPSSFQLAPTPNEPLEEITFTGDGDEVLVTLNIPNGTVEFGPSYDPDDMSEMFWKTIAGGCPKQRVPHAVRP